MTLEYAPPRYPAPILTGPGRVFTLCPIESPQAVAAYPVATGKPAAALQPSGPTSLCVAGRRANWRTGCR